MNGRDGKKCFMDVPMPLRVGLLCGLVGVLVDLDHPISLILYKGHFRFLHPYLGLAACIVCICIGTLVGRLYIKHLLDKRKKIV